MTDAISNTKAVGSESLGKVILEDGAYTVMSLWDQESQAQEANSYVDACCDGCPSYTTVPCSC